MSRPGQPTLYRAEYHPTQYLELSRNGKSLTQIAAAWDVTRQTIYEWTKVHAEFSDAVIKGRELVENWYESLGQAAMVGAAQVNGKSVDLNWTGFKWMTMNVCKWRHNVTQEVSGVNGKPMEFKNLSEGELRARAAELAAEIARGGVSEAASAESDSGPTSGDASS